MKTVYTIPDLNLDVILPFPMADIAQGPIVSIYADRIEVGYLVHDEDCEDPLDSSDFAGHIYTARRHSPTLLDYERELALGRFGEGKRNPHAVMLDVYEHGLVQYSVAGEGMRCQFDTARGGAVWVPSKALLEDFDGSDPDWACKHARLAAEQYTDWCNGECYGTVVATYTLDGKEVDHDACWGYVGADDAYSVLQQEMPEVTHAV